jgi:hypothetical protein
VTVSSTFWKFQQLRQVLPAVRSNKPA